MERYEPRREVDQGESGYISSTKHRNVSIMSRSHEHIFLLRSILFDVHILIVVYSYSASNNNRLSSMSMGPPPAHPHASYPHDPAKNSAYSSNVAGTSSIAHYDPYAPPRRPSGILAPIPSSSSSSGPKPPGFYKTIVSQGIQY